MKVYEKIYVGGEWVPSTGDANPMFEVVDSSTEEVLAKVPAGTKDDVEKAVAAAKAAFPAWSGLTVKERADYLRKIQAGLQARTNEVAETVAREVGMPLKLATMIQAGLPTMQLGNFADAAEKLEYEVEVGNSLVVKEPVGVVGCITPWNYPLNQVVAKVGAAMVMGCTVVLKPSEVAPISAFILAEVIDGAGVPKGVFNLVSGDGLSVGDAISRHPDVDMVSFTGSTRAGREVSKAAADTIKRVHLELGGKSASVILDDADLKKAVKGTISACYLNSGQTCSAHTRMLVPKSKHDEAKALAKEIAEGFTLGNAVGGEGKLGPLVSAVQRDRVRGYIQKGIDEGAELVTGGPEQPEGLEKGFFVKPTVFAGATSEMTIAREEIFGPVLTIIPYEDEADAIRIANDSPYGLAGGVWSGDQERAKRVARQIRTGQVDINGGRFNPLAPFGGYKQSGNGREWGSIGLEEFLEVKSMQL